MQERTITDLLDMDLYNVSAFAAETNKLSTSLSYAMVVIVGVVEQLTRALYKREKANEGIHILYPASTPEDPGKAIAMTSTWCLGDEAMYCRSRPIGFE